MHNDYDDWNKAKREYGQMMSSLTHINMFLMGIGVPARQASYILGRPPEFALAQGMEKEKGAGGGKGQSYGGSGRRDSD